MEHLQQAVTILNNSGVIIFPTDTAFGIGCRADDEKAVKRLFEIRKRPENKPTPVLVNNIELVEKYVDEVPEKVRAIMKQYWPGGLTIVLNSTSSDIVPLVKGGTRTLGVRMPDHEIPLSLIEQIDVPLLAPSANFSGEDTPYSYEELNPEIVKEVDLVIPGECSTKQASTVIDCTSEPWEIIRQGSVVLGLRS